MHVFGFFGVCERIPYRIRDTVSQAKEWTQMDLSYWKSWAEASNWQIRPMCSQEAKPWSVLRMQFGQASREGVTWQGGGGGWVVQKQGKVLHLNCMKKCFLEQMNPAGRRTFMKELRRSAANQIREGDEASQNCIKLWKSKNKDGLASRRIPVCDPLLIVS